MEVNKLIQILKNRNVFLTGGAGVGKSYLTKQLINNYSGNLITLAPTGISAVNIGGQTIHSFFEFSRNTELESVIKAFGYESYLSIGELFDYYEKSFIIYDIEKEDALNLAKKFDQYSIFYNSGEYISITECDSGRDILKYEYIKHFN